MDSIETSSAQHEHSSWLESPVWVVVWLAALACLLAYFFASEKATLWVWAALLLLALVCPSPSVCKKLFGHKLVH